eukprot:g14783.t1
MALEQSPATELTAFDTSPGDEDPLQPTLIGNSGIIGGIGNGNVGGGLAATGPSASSASSSSKEKFHGHRAWLQVRAAQLAQIALGLAVRGVSALARVSSSATSLTGTTGKGTFGGAFAYPVFYTCLGSGLIYWQRAVMSIIMVKGVAQEFELSTIEQGEVLSAFFLGYIIGGFTASQVLQRSPMPLYLPNFILKSSILCSAVCTFYIATLAKTKLQLEYARLLTGIGQGFFFPSCYVLLAQVVASPGRKTTALGRMGAATPGAVALTYFVSAEIPEWHHAVVMSAVSAAPVLVAMMLAGDGKEYAVEYQEYEEGNASCADDGDVGEGAGMDDDGNGPGGDDDGGGYPLPRYNESGGGSVLSNLVGSVTGSNDYAAKGSYSVVGRASSAANGGTSLGQAAERFPFSEFLPASIRSVFAFRGNGDGGMRGQRDWINFAGDYIVPSVDVHAGINRKSRSMNGQSRGSSTALVEISSTGSSTTASSRSAAYSSAQSIFGEDRDPLSPSAGSSTALQEAARLNGTSASTASLAARSAATARAMNLNENGTATSGTSKQPISVLEIVFSKPFLAIMCCHFCHNWCNFILLAWLPTFFGKKNVVMSAFPYLLCSIAAPVFPYYCELQLAKKRELWHVRRELATVALLLPAVIFTFMPFVEDHRVQSAMFSAVLVFGAAIHSSVLAGPLDLAGESHVGTLLATTNMVGAVPGIVGVRAAAYFKESLGWNGVFVSCAVLYYVAIVVYLTFGSVKRLV